MTLAFKIWSISFLHLKAGWIKGGGGSERAAGSLNRLSSGIVVHQALFFYFRFFGPLFLDFLDPSLLKSNNIKDHYGWDRKEGLGNKDLLAMHGK